MLAFRLWGWMGCLSGSCGDILMALQIINPEWLASPEGKEWAKELQERRDKIIAEAFNKFFTSEMEDES